MTPPTDIVISTRITREFPTEALFNKCIETLRVHTHNFRPIIVDDNSDEMGGNLVAALASTFHSGIFIRTNFQHWFTRAFNLGLRMVRTPWAVMLNSDTELDTGWLDELYAIKDELEGQGQRVGLVGSTVSAEEPRRYAICMHPGYVTGHALLLNMQAISDISAARGTPGLYLDETNPAMIHIRSDIEICYKLMSHNWLCVSSFKSLVGHHGGKTWGFQLGRIPHSLDSVTYKY